MRSEAFDTQTLSGRNRRLLNEWRQLEQHLTGRSDLTWHVVKTNAEGLPVSYCVDYHVRSICGVTNIDHLNEAGVSNEPIFAHQFTMQIDLPPTYPQVDGAPQLCFLTADAAGQPIAHPWHPNIRYFGPFAGRVCINMVDTYTDLLWGIRRVASYLRYHTYHATMEPPYPEDLQVAAWVRQQGEPNEWIYFDE